MVAPCDCWTEWNNWSTCTKSCGRGLMKRTREKNMRSTQRCIGSAEETSVCNTESCDEERRILVLGGRGLYMQEQSIINTATGTELQRRERSFHKFAMHCTAALNKKVFIIGGYYSRRYIHSISDAECNVEKMPITLPMDYMRHSCTNHNGKIWICGTYKEPNRCDSFNGYQMRMEPSTRQRHSSGMLVSVPSRGLMILGGSGKSGRNKAVEILVGRNWQTGPDLPTEISLASAQAIGEDLFIFGGQGSSRKTNSVYKLARGREKWEEITPKLRNVRASHMSVLVGSKVYLIGGQGDLPVEVWEENRRSTRELSQISHKNRLYTSATVLPSNVCSAFRNN